MEILDRSTTANSDRIKQLGWNPSYKTYQEGLDQTIFIWQQQGNNK